MRPINPLVLWLCILAGPVAFGIVRLAGIVLLQGRCLHPTGTATILGLSSSQQLMAAITIVCALIAGLSGVASWHIWNRIRRPDEDRSGESLRTMPFFALGGFFLSGVFFVIIILTGGLAIGLSTVCAS